MGTMHGKELREVLPMMHFALLLRDGKEYGIALATLKSPLEWHHADLYVTIDAADESITMGPYPLDYYEEELMKKLVPFPSQIMGEKNFITIKAGKKS